MNNSNYSDDPEVKRMQFLWAAGSIHARKHPQLSRHFVSTFATSTKQASVQDLGAEVEHQYCPHCHTLLLPDNHSVKLKSKPRQTGKIRKLQKRAERHALLSTKDRKELRHWMNATTKMVLTCNICDKRSRHVGGKRQSTSAIRAYPHTSTPAGRRKIEKQSPATPGNQNRSWTNLTPGSNRSCGNSSNSSTPYSTPSSRRVFRTPSSGTPPMGTPQSGSSARNLKKSKRDKHQQLQRMLATSKKEKDNAAKSPLSAFLTSL